MEVIAEYELRERPWGVEIVDGRARVRREFRYPSHGEGGIKGKRGVRQRARLELARMEAATDE